MHEETNRKCLPEVRAHWRERERSPERLANRSLETRYRKLETANQRALASAM